MTDSQKILKRLPNGYIIPYPDELIHHDLLFLKDYRINRYPGMEAGRPADISYEDYVEWLAAYLLTCDITLTKEQERIRDYITSDTEGMGITLGWISAFYQSIGGTHPFYHFPEDFEETPDIEAVKGAIYEDPYLELLDLLDDDDDKPDKLAFILEDYGWFLMMKTDLDEFRKYWPGFIPLEPIHWMAGSDGPFLEYPDYGWRVYLSILLKSTPNKVNRIEHIDKFFREYNSTIQK